MSQTDAGSRSHQALTGGIGTTCALTPGWINAVSRHWQLQEKSMFFKMMPPLRIREGILTFVASFLFKHNTWNTHQPGTHCACAEHGCKLWQHKTW
jgi:hypothetical protein